MDSESESALIDRFIQTVSRRLHIIVACHSDKIVFRLPEYMADPDDAENTSILFTIDRFVLLQRLRAAASTDLWKAGFFAGADGVFEHPVRFTDGLMQRWLSRDRCFECHAREHPVSLCISVASPECVLSSIVQDKEFQRLFVRGFSGLLESKSVDELMRSAGVAVLRIESSLDLDTVTLESLAKDYLLNIAMARGLSLELSPVGGSRQIGRRRGAGGQYSLFPYKEYDERVSRYYHQAIVANELPFAQYLAFYQVIEYYYDKALKDSVMAILEDVTTNVYPTKTALENTYKRLNVEFQGENARGRELADLKRCVERQVDLIALTNRLDELDEDAVEYYRKNNVRFVREEKNPKAEKGLKITLRDTQGDPKKTKDAIAERIYAVRCSIVHSKSDVASNYQPFLHDDDLAKEVPLVRAVAEQMMLGAAPMRELPTSESSHC